MLNLMICLILLALDRMRRLWMMVMRTELLVSCTSKRHHRSGWFDLIQGCMAQRLDGPRFRSVTEYMDWAVNIYCNCMPSILHMSPIIVAVCRSEYVVKLTFSFPATRSSHCASQSPSCTCEPCCICLLFQNCRRTSDVQRPV